MAEQRELSLILTLQDRVSRDLKGVQGKLKSLQPTFKKMAVAGTVAFGAIATASFNATQKAVDAQEVFNKFDVVFGDVSDEAQKMAMDLRNNFGLAESSAKDLLSSTGDMLTGFGLSGEAALDLATKTNKLAVDLASFTNIEGGAERASKALTKALLGERESVKELGIAILEEDVKAKVEAMRAAGKFTDETLRQQRAMATLEIAVSQSKNAVGDFARTQDSLANRQRVMQERMKEMTETIGIALIPVLEKLVNIVEPIIKRFSEWAKENPGLLRTIVLVSGGLAGVVAVVGTLGLILPSLITVFSALGGVLMFLATNPIGLTIVAVGALITAAVILIRNWDKVKRFFKDTWDGIKMIFKEGIDRIMGWLNPLINAVNKVKSVGSTIGSKIGGAVRSVIPGLADGGIVRKPTLAMIGEAGPEAVVPLNKAGGMGITVNIMGGYYLDRNAGQMLADSIGEELRRRLRL